MARKREPLTFDPDAPWGEHGREWWQSRYETDLEALMSLPPHMVNDTPSLAATSVLKEVVGRAIDNLDERDRYLIEALLIEGLSLRRVEALTGIPKTTVARWRDRIRRSLIADLAESPAVQNWLRGDY